MSKYKDPRTTKQIQQEYYKVCTQLGQAIYQETEAIELQAQFKEEQELLAKAFKAATIREQEAAAQQARAAAAKTEFDSNAKTPPLTELENNQKTEIIELQTEKTVGP